MKFKMSVLLKRNEKLEHFDNLANRYKSLALPYSLGEETEGIKRKETIRHELYLEWYNYKMFYGKAYFGSLENNNEEKLRREYYMKSRESVQCHKAQFLAQKVQFLIGINQFSDWSQNEINDLLYEIYPKTDSTFPINRREWELYKIIFGKCYSVDEDNERFNHYKRNKKLAIEHNKNFERRKVGYCIGISQFFDWSEIELSVLLTKQNPDKFPTFLFNLQTSISEDEWQCYKLLYGKIYVNLDEDKRRRLLYEKEKQYFISFNLKYEENNGTIPYGVNQYSDWMDEEKDKLHGRLIPQEREFQNDILRQFNFFKLVYGKITEHTRSYFFKKIRNEILEVNKYLGLRIVINQYASWIPNDILRIKYGLLTEIHLPRMLWNHYKKRFGKVYNNPRKDEIRRGILAFRIKWAKELNTKFENGKIPYAIGINQYSDWFPDEMKDKLYGIYPDDKTEELEKPNEWNCYKKIFGKYYRNDDEDKRRHDIYLQNKRIAIEENRRNIEKPEKYKIEINQFMDWTKEELQKLSNKELYEWYYFSSPTNNEEDMLEEWKLYKRTYGKLYENQEDEEQHFNVFRQFRIEAFENNKKYEQGYVLFVIAVNQYSDLNEDIKMKIIKEIIPHENDENYWNEFKTYFGKIYYGKTNTKREEFYENSRKNVIQYNKLNEKLFELNQYSDLCGKDIKVFVQYHAFALFNIKHFSGMPQLNLNNFRNAANPKLHYTSLRSQEMCDKTLGQHNATSKRQRKKRTKRSRDKHISTKKELTFETQPKIHSNRLKLERGHPSKNFSRHDSKTGVYSDPCPDKKFHCKPAMCFKFMAPPGVSCISDRPCRSNKSRSCNRRDKCKNRLCDEQSCAQCPRYICFPQYPPCNCSSCNGKAQVVHLPFLSCSPCQLSIECEHNSCPDLELPSGNSCSNTNNNCYSSPDCKLDTPPDVNSCPDFNCRDSTDSDFKPTPNYTPPDVNPCPDSNCRDSTDSDFKPTPNYTPPDINPCPDSNCHDSTDSDFKPTPNPTPPDVNPCPDSNCHDSTDSDFKPTPNPTPPDVNPCPDSNCQDCTDRECKESPNPTPPDINPCPDSNCRDCTDSECKESPNPTPPNDKECTEPPEIPCNTCPPDLSCQYGKWCSCNNCPNCYNYSHVTCYSCTHSYNKCRNNSCPQRPPCSSCSPDKCFSCNRRPGCHHYSCPPYYSCCPCHQCGPCCKRPLCPRPPSCPPCPPQGRPSCHDRPCPPCPSCPPCPPCKDKPCKDCPSCEECPPCPPCKECPPCRECPPCPISIKVQWEKYKKRYGKLYPDPNEDRKRFNQYKKTTQIIRSHTDKFIKRKVGFLLLENQFSDWYDNELSAEGLLVLRSSGDPSNDHEWEKYKVTFGKRYTKQGGEDNERRARYEETKRFLIKYNNQTNYSATLNQVSDWTFQEIIININSLLPEYCIPSDTIPPPMPPDNPPPPPPPDSPSPPPDSSPSPPPDSPPQPPPDSPPPPPPDSTPPPDNPPDDSFGSNTPDTNASSSNNSSHSPNNSPPSSPSNSVPSDSNPDSNDNTINGTNSSTTPSDKKHSTSSSISPSPSDNTPPPPPPDNPPPPPPPPDSPPSPPPDSPPSPPPDSPPPPPPPPDSPPPPPPDNPPPPPPDNPPPPPDNPPNDNFGSNTPDTSASSSNNPSHSPNNSPPSSPSINNPGDSDPDSNDDTIHGTKSSTTPSDKKHSSTDIDNSSSDHPNPNPDKRSNSNNHPVITYSSQRNQTCFSRLPACIRLINTIKSKKKMNAEMGGRDKRQGGGYDQDPKVKDEEWRDYKRMYGKKYANKNEDATRRRNYEESKKMVVEHNNLFKDGKVNFEVGINEFSDWNKKDRIDFLHFDPKKRPDILDFIDYCACNKY